MSGPVLLAFVIWMMLTAEFSLLNAVIGFAGSCAASVLQPYRFSAIQLMHLAALTLLNIPRAIGETFLLVFIPHRYELTRTHELKNPGNPWAVFLETFVITFTPMTLVTSAEEDGRIHIHVVSRKGRS